MSHNPSYLGIGDDYWTPYMVSTVWLEAETAGIPVQGTGYQGAYTGPGFDSLWTDMSEIVRPTRDGIHGREYISTSIDLGRMPSYINFDAQGNLSKSFPLVISIPLPLLFDLYQLKSTSRDFLKIVCQSSKMIGNFTFIGFQDYSIELASFAENIIPVLTENDCLEGILKAKHRIVEVEYNNKMKGSIRQLRHKTEKSLVSARISLLSPFESLVYDALDEGVDIIHLCAGIGGRVDIEGQKGHIKDALLSLHSSMVQKAVRDEVTLIVSGGIDMAEHMPKAIICGADGVSVDVTLLVAIGCRISDHDSSLKDCPVLNKGVEEAWGVQRLVNLAWSWRNQMLEIMGAMGIREARRLRGETGRAMFYEDQESTVMKSIFHIRDEG